jgi:hypothetical protein
MGFFKFNFMKDVFQQNKTGLCHTRTTKEPAVCRGLFNRSAS